MKIKTVLVAGLAAGIGYVLGTKAGRARFEELRSRAVEFVESPKVQETVSNLSETVKQSAHKLPDPVADVVTAVADSVKGSTTEPDVCERADVRHPADVHDRAEVPARPVTRRLAVGCEFVHRSSFDVAAVFQVEPVADQQADQVEAHWAMDPEGPTRTYRDLYGNLCRRLVIPAGRSVITYHATMVVPDALDDADEDAPELPADQLPDDVLIFTLPSRYCLPDVLGGEAWSRFGALPPGYRRVQAICDYVNGHLKFSYGTSNSRSTAADVHASGYGVCRDFTHLAVSLCRALNIPARYVFGYLPEIEVPTARRADGLCRLDGGLSGRSLVDLRPAQQRAAQGPGADRAWPRCRRRGHGHHLRGPASGVDEGDCPGGGRLPSVRECPPRLAPLVEHRRSAPLAIGGTMSGTRCFAFREE